MTSAPSGRLGGVGNYTERERYCVKGNVHRRDGEIQKQTTASSAGKDRRTVLFCLIYAFIFLFFSLICQIWIIKNRMSCANPLKKTMFLSSQCHQILH